MKMKRRRGKCATVPSVIIPTTLDVAPEPHEVELAWILARHYQTIVEFLKPIKGYRIKTADIVMVGLIWEFKSPKGNSKKHTIKDQFNRAKGKKRHLVIDGRRTKLEDDLIKERILFELKTHKSVQKLIFVTKSGEVVEIK